MKWILIVYFIGTMVGGTLYDRSLGGATSAEFNTQDACEEALIKTKALKGVYKVLGFCTEGGEKDE